MRRFVIGLAILALASLASQMALADDQAIAQSILRQLKTQQQQGKLKDFDLDLTVEDGNVWLKGRVATTAQQTLAVDIARRTRGVKKVINGLEKPSPSRSTTGSTTAAKPQPKVTAEKSTTARTASSTSAGVKAIAQRTASEHKEIDKQIADSIVTTLQKHQKQGQLKGFDLNLYVDKGTVWMKGNVSDIQQQRLALDVARRTKNVRQVVNDLSIEAQATKSAKTASHPQPGSAQSDTARPTKAQPVKAPPIQAKPAISATRKGQPIKAQPAKAIKTATRASHIAPATGSIDDKQIVASIKSKLAQYQQRGQLKGFGVNLHSKDGVVWLKGQVSTPQQRNLILSIASHTHGVNQVVNDIQMRSALTTTGPNAPAKQARTLWPNAGMPNAATQSQFKQGTSSIQPVSNPYVTRDPEPAASSDQQLAESIANRFRQYKQQGVLRGFGIDLLSENGVITMQGRVSSTAQEKLAIDIARRTPGVRRVVSQLEVVAAQRQTAAQRSAPAPKIAISEATAPNRPTIGNRAETKTVSHGQPAASQQFVAQQSQQMATMPQSAQHDANTPVGTSVTAQHPQAAYQSAYAAAYAQAQAQAYAQQMAHLQASAAVDQTPRPLTPVRAISHAGMAALAAPLAIGHAIGQQMPGAGPMPTRMPGGPAGAIAPARYDHPQMPNYAWPSYASHPNYAAVTYPKQYSPSAWPYIGPFYPYPQVPLGWRKVALEWDDGWWMLDFYDK